MNIAICSCGKAHFVYQEKRIILLCQHCGQIFSSDPKDHESFLDSISESVAEEAIDRDGFSLHISSGKNIYMTSGFPATHFDGKTLFDFHDLSVGEDLFAMYRFSIGIDTHLQQDLKNRMLFDDEKNKQEFSPAEYKLLKTVL